MFGEEIIVRTMSNTVVEDKDGQKWQYHSRSDAHSKAACWAIMFDLLNSCELMARHAKDRKIGFGINHKMHDWAMNRDKDLDLVVCTPTESGFDENTFADYVDIYGIKLNEEESAILKSLPPLYKCKVGSSLVALEAKACMTEHVKARPRLYDELTSSHQTVHGDTKNTIAVGFIVINSSKTFISPGMNKGRTADNIFVTEHKQPYAAEKVYEKMQQLHRRTRLEDIGFDAIGIVFMKCKNDGSIIEIDREMFESIGVDKSSSYGKMIERVKVLYTSAFGHL